MSISLILSGIKPNLNGADRRTEVRKALLNTIENNYMKDGQFTASEANDLLDKVQKDNSLNGSDATLLEASLKLMADYNKAYAGLDQTSTKGIDAEDLDKMKAIIGKNHNGFGTADKEGVLNQALKIEQPVPSKQTGKPALTSFTLSTSGTAPQGATDQQQKGTTTPQQDSQATLSQSLKDINPSGVNQGGYGDCVFESSLASLTSTPNGKQQISKMISVNPDGSYKVTFPGESSKPIMVTKDDLDKYGSQNSALWAKVIETAYIKAHPKEAEGNFDAVSNKDRTPAQWALNLLTGNNACKATASDKDMGSKLDQALNKNHQSVVAFCADENGKALVSSHEWTVTGYDPATKTVTVRNPWGHNDLKLGETKNGVTALEDGQMKMSLSTFGKHYIEVTMASSPVAA